MIGRLAAGLLGVLRDEPVLLIGAGSATGTVLAFLGVDKAVLGMIGTLLTALLLLARRVVTPVGKVEAVATSAAATAVSALDEGTIGAVGDITETAADAIDSAVTGTLALAGIGTRRTGPPDVTAVHPAGRITVDPDSIARAVGCCLDVTVDGQIVGRTEEADAEPAVDE